MITNNNKILSFTLFLLSFLINLILSTVFFSSLSEKELSAYFNSDNLFIPALYKDLIDNNGSIFGWNLGTSIYLFPNMFFYFVIQTITKNFIFTSYLLSFIQFLLFIFFMNKIVKEGSVHFTYDILTITNILLSLFILIGKKEYLLALHYYIPLHMGVFTIALMIIYLSLKFLKKPNKKYIITIILLSIISVASDGIFVEFYILPSIIVLYIIYVKYRNKNFIKLLFYNLISLILGKLFLLLLKLSFHFHSKEPSINSPNILKSLNICLHQFYDYLLSGNLKTFIWLISIITFFFILTYLFKNFSNDKIAKAPFHYFYLCFIIAFSVIVFFSPALMGIYYDYSNIRYNIFVYYFLLGNFPFIIHHLFKVVKLLKYMSLIIVFILALFLGFKISSPSYIKGINKNLNYYPTLVMFVDELSKFENLKAGVADYWDGRVVSMLSKNKTVVNHVFLNNLSPYYHLNSLKNYLYYPNDSTIWYNFIIYHANLDTNFVHSTFGNFVIISNGNYSIIKVPEFRYNPNDFTIVLKDSIK